MKKSASILIVEDDVALSQMLALHFEDLGHQVIVTGSCAQALHELSLHIPDLVLLDQQLPDGLGIELLPQLIEQSSQLPVIMMTGQHDLELAIEAIKLGATDFIHKPVKTELLQNAVDQVLQQPRPEPPPDQIEANTGGLIGKSEGMLQVSKDIGLCASNLATVLINGESGTGKELVAELIHRFSGRPGPFIAVNCAALVSTLLESELFGHEKGAFTGATARKPGRFELANNGTIFLDEIAEMEPSLQAKLLRVLQQKNYETVGGTQTLTTNARVIAATHKDIFEEVQQGNFREDLAYRLNVINIQIPPLRDRSEDIPVLATALLDKAAQQMDIEKAHLSEAAMSALKHYPWPGNVRELENALTQALVHARGGEITPEQLHLRELDTAVTSQVETELPLQSLEQVEAAHIQKVLHHTRGHKGQSCEILGISRPALDRKIKKYDLKVG